MIQETTSTGYLTSTTASHGWYDPQVGTAVASSGTIQFNTPTVPLCAAGHEADPNYAEYLDGEIATTCAVCKQRITFQHLPGGVPLLRLKSLLESVMGGDYDRSRALEDFAAITDALNTERSVLDAADALAALARTLLEQ